MLKTKLRFPVWTLLMIFFFASGTFASGVANGQPSKQEDAQIPIVKALRDVSKVYDTKFVYEKSLLEGKTTSFAMKDIKKGRKVEDILKSILYPKKLVFLYIKENYYTIVSRDRLEQQQKSYQVRNNNVDDNNDGIQIGNSSNISSHSVSGLSSASVIAHIVSGQVSNLKGEPLVGVSITVKGTGVGTSSDGEGSYSIDVPEGRTLIFSYVGFITKEVLVNKGSEIDVVMETSVSALDQVVVVGYGTQKKINLTGAVDVVSGEALQNRPAATVSQLLEGTSPNLNITLTSRGGEPGATSNWNIRGVGSSSGSSPLILIDGVEGNVDLLDPETIESVSVLKDASASAIYGSRAPFGVVLITTKKGKKNNGISIQYNTNFAWASPLRLPEFVDALTWASTYNQIQESAGLAPVYPDEQVERIKEYMAGTIKTQYDLDHPFASVWRGRWEGNANYNYPRLFFKNNSFSPKHNINLQGGNDKTQYFVSGGYYDQGGLYNYGYDSYKRYNLMANLTSKVNNWLRFDFGTKYSQTLTDYPIGQGGNTDRAYFIHELLTFGPMTAMYDKDGTTINPLIRGMESAGRNKTTINDLWLRLGAEIEPIKGWKTNINYNYNYDGSSNAQNPIPVPIPVPNGTIGNVGAPISGAVSNLGVDNYFIFNAYSTYEKALGDHFFKAMIGYEEELKNYNTLSGSRMNLITEAIPSINAALGESTLGASSGHWANEAVFGRLNYNFKEKFLVELSGRYNGSSRFAKDSRWGFFPSGSAGYNLSKEKFWNPIEPYVNTVKIRGSYGSLGNQNVSNYLYISTIPVYSNLNYIVDGTRPIYAQVPGILGSGQTWETITTLNFGLDAAFLNNRLGLTLDKYWRKTSNMFGPSVSLPAVLGTGAPAQNNAELQTKGFELSLSWKDKITSSFNYNIGLSLADNTTTILKYLNPLGDIDNWYAGKNYGEIWGFITDAIMQDANEKMPDQSKYYATWGPGDMKYKDLNGDGILNDGQRLLSDHGDLTVIGNSIPRYTFGVSAGFNWKNFSFNMFWQGIGKHNFLPPSGSLFWGIISGGSPGSESAIMKGSPVLNYWRPEDETSILGPNTNAYFARPYFTSELSKNRLPQSRYVLNAAYARLKSLQIGYTIPEGLIKRISIKNIRVYISGENLITFTSLPKILDPETAIASDFSSYTTANGTYPISKTVSVGANITF